VRIAVAGEVGERCLGEELRRGRYRGLAHGRQCREQILCRHAVLRGWVQAEDLTAVLNRERRQAAVYGNPVKSGDGQARLSFTVAGQARLSFTVADQAPVHRADAGHASSAQEERLVLHQMLELTRVQLQQQLGARCRDRHVEHRGTDFVLNAWKADPIHAYVQLGEQVGESHLVEVLDL